MPPFHERRRLSLSDFPLDLFEDDAVVDAQKAQERVKEYKRKSEAEENKRRAEEMLRAKEWKEKFRVLEKPVDAVGLAKRRIQKYKRTEEQRKLKEQEKSRGQRWYQKRSKLKTGTNKSTFD